MRYRKYVNRKHVKEKLLEYRLKKQVCFEFDFICFKIIVLLQGYDTTVFVTAGQGKSAIIYDATQKKSSKVGWSLS